MERSAETAIALNEKQRQLVNLPIADILVVAPAGCGKTEALASRAGSLAQREELKKPKKVLALSFSNRAKNNLAGRIRSVIGPVWRDHVDVMNFHGFAARVVLAHGKAAGIRSDLLLPDRGWRAQHLAALDIPWSKRGQVEETLRSAKAGAYSDEDVWDRIVGSGTEMALQFERAMREADRIDFDDLLRYGLRVLQVPSVADLYSGHFGAVLVDEVQDLTRVHLAVADAVGKGKTTFAGDLAQGIYGFAGAKPEEIFKDLRDRCEYTVTFSESYRASRQVLRTVNAFANVVSSPVLERDETNSADGEVLVLETHTPEDEARALLNWLGQQVRARPDWSFGVIMRRGSRGEQLREALDEAGFPYEDWTNPGHAAFVVDLLARYRRRAITVSEDEQEQLAALAGLCMSEVDEADVDSRSELLEALASLGEFIANGKSLTEAIMSCRPGRDIEVHAGPGVHMLNGHVGKGQEFSCVIVLGLEEGQVPDFRSTHGRALSEEGRVLHVMLSRARNSLVLTKVERTMSRSGWWEQAPSRWWSILAATATGELARVS